jgi:UMF1 family MFS transporter
MSIISKIKTTNREHLAWYLYDFGNSAYAAIILLAVYAAYFKDTVVGGYEGTDKWGTSLFIAMLVVAVTSPIFGAIADFSGSKKRFLFFFSLLTWIFTALLFFVREGNVFIGMLFFIIAEIGYRSGQVFYNSLLPEITTPEERGRVSGNAWAIGSFGGILSLLILLPLIMIFEGQLMVRLSFVFTAFYFALATIPTFLWIKERAVPKQLPEGENYLSLGYSRIKQTITKMKDFKEFLRFILAFFIYNDGILMALTFSSIIGHVLFGMEQTDLIIFMIVVQVTSVIGAYVAGLMGDKIGYKQSLVYSLILMILVVIGMIFAQNVIHFYIIGSLAGFALTGVQSVSRTLVGYFSPPGRSAEFYGFFAISGRASSVIGPKVYSVFATLTTIYLIERGYGDLIAEQMGLRIALTSIALFLIVGLLILLGLKDPTKEYIKP